MKNNNVLITGGASGLGRAIGEHLYSKGSNLFIIDKVVINKIDKNYAAKIKKYYNLDLNNIIQLKEILDSEDFPEIDILINNAALRLFKPFNEFEEHDITRYLHINISAPIIITKSILHKMINKKFGRIINISSRAGFYGYTLGSLYCASKSFLIRFTESLSKEFENMEQDITVNVICPSALTNIDGTFDKNYSKKLEKILMFIDTIIDKKVNGKCYSTLSFKEKFYYAVKTDMQMFKN